LGSLWHLFGSNNEETCTERSCLMYEKVIGWFWWSVVAIVALHFGFTCGFAAAFRAVRGGECFGIFTRCPGGSGTCNFFSNGYHGQIMCMWTGLAALGAGLRYDDFVSKVKMYQDAHVVKYSVPNNTSEIQLWLTAHVDQRTIKEMGSSMAAARPIYSQTGCWGGGLVEMRALKSFGRRWYSHTTSS